MRALAIAVLLACVAPAAADPVAAKAANARGIAALKQRDLPAAATAFRAALVADPDHVLAHYNLACTASLMKDRATALAQLAWLGNRAVYDRSAKQALGKARKDRDLAWIFEDAPEDASDAIAPAVPALNLLDPNARTGGNPVVAAERASIEAALAGAPGNHDARCDAKHAEQGEIWEVAGSGGDGEDPTLRASLRDGVALYTTRGAPTSRSEPLGCSAPRAAGDRIIGLVAVHPAMVFVELSNGSAKDWRREGRLFSYAGGRLVQLFAAETGASKTGRGKLVMTPANDLIHTPPGGKPVVQRWDPAAKRYVELGPPR